MSADEEEPYHIVEAAGRFRVEDQNGGVMLETGDERNAQHYLTLMTKAYRRGYRAGYRAAKNA